MRKYCANCGQKFYPKTWAAYPQSEYGHLVPDEHKHFHAQYCMKEWIAKNHEAFTLLLTSMGNNDRNNETIERTYNGKNKTKPTEKTVAKKRVATYCL